MRGNKRARNWPEITVAVLAFVLSALARQRRSPKLVLTIPSAQNLRAVLVPVGFFLERILK